MSTQLRFEGSSESSSSVSGVVGDWYIVNILSGGQRSPPHVIRPVTPPTHVDMATKDMVAFDPKDVFYTLCLIHSSMCWL